MLPPQFNFIRKATVCLLSFIPICAESEAVGMVFTMKQLFRCADHYIQSRDWKMLTGLKFCLCSIGILLGVLVPVKHKKTVAAGAFGVFLATYIPLMTDFLTFAVDFFRPKKETVE